MILCLIADGRSIHTQRWAEYFAQRGHEVHLITYDPMGRNIEGVHEHVITSRWKNLYLSFWPRHYAIDRIIKKIKPDLIHAHFIAKYGFHLPFLGNYPKIVTAWGDDILILPQSSRILFFFTRHVLNSVDLNYAVSHDIRDHIINDFTIPETKVHYLPFGVDTYQFSPPQDSPDKEKKTVVIFSNRGFLPIYGMDTILKGFHLAIQQNHDLQLILKGEGPDKEKIRQEIKRLGLEATVTIKNKTDYNEVIQDLKNADIFITASGRDGTPVSLLEAMSAGLPCIATAVGGIPEWISDGKNGILIPPDNPEIIAQKIILLSSDIQKRKTLGFHARKTILKKGDWATLMKSAEKDYSTILRKKDLLDTSN
jgi:glycosyltransferase involved in cell wall biosynthesis